MNNIDFNLKVNVADKMVCPREWSWDTGKFLKDFDIWMILNGRGSLQTEGGVFNLNPGDCFVFHPGKRYIGQHDPDNPLTVIFIHFSFVDDTGIALQLDEPYIPRLYRKINHSPFFLALLDRVLTSYRDEHGKNEADSWLKVLFYEISRYDTTKEYSQYEREKYSEMNQLCDEIIHKPGYPWNIDEMAQRLSYSKDHFIRLFKRFKGMTPNEFIIRVRIDAAKAYLTSSSLSIAQIAYMVGWGEVSYFSRQFKQRTGISPMQYRKDAFH